MRAYLAKMTGLNRAQAARLIRRYQQGGIVSPTVTLDIELLGAVDEAHETWSGPARRG